MTKPVQISRYRLVHMAHVLDMEGPWVKYEDHQAALSQVRSLLEAKAKEWIDYHPVDEIQLGELIGREGCAAELMRLAATLGNQGK